MVGRPFLFCGAADTRPDPADAGAAKLGRLFKWMDVNGDGRLFMNELAGSLLSVVDHHHAESMKATRDELAAILAQAGKPGTCLPPSTHAWMHRTPGRHAARSLHRCHGAAARGRVGTSCVPPRFRDTHGRT